MEKQFLKGFLDLFQLSLIEKLTDDNLKFPNLNYS